MIQLVECPRDAMQGRHAFIPTAQKTAYLQQLLAVGFHTLDFGSFVSARVIPQMQDTAQVLAGLNLEDTQTRLLAIVANSRGAETAAAYGQIACLGYPLSLSETFQQRNTRQSVAAALQQVAELQELCTRKNKILVVYLSMGFGNPYGDPWHPDRVLDFAARMAALQVGVVSLADTTGQALPADIGYLFGQLVPAYPQLTFGAHFHAPPQDWQPKVEAAFRAGCRRFDGALLGYGGCPMARDELVGNLATENLIAYFENIDLPLNLNRPALGEALRLARAVFLPES
ncbi:MAG: hydroxymethylglutaryl-CoA lyase [Adhaeribacter sp.]